jgi:hypothetical protein
MDFDEAIEFLRIFPSCHPKVFKGFVEWGVCDTETDGYVVLTDVALAKAPCSNQMYDYVKSHNLRIDHQNDYLMICSRF